VVESTKESLLAALKKTEKLFIHDDVVIDSPFFAGRRI
jgi:hypothetical protein